MKLLLVVLVCAVASSGLSAQGVLGRRAVVPLVVAVPFAACANVGDVLQAAQRNNEITYSANGRNIQRMSRGDYSMGSKQTSTSERGTKRRAAMACKSPKALKEAGVYADEAACTRDVLAGQAQTMLDALDRLGDQCKVDATHVCL